MVRLVEFPNVRRPVPQPDAVRVAFDFNRWCVDYLSGGRVLRSVECSGEREARAQAASACADQGMAQLPDRKPVATVYGGNDHSDL